jgi:hypothetical protein
MEPNLLTEPLIFSTINDSQDVQYKSNSVIERVKKSLNRYYGSLLMAIAISMYALADGLPKLIFIAHPTVHFFHVLLYRCAIESFV